MAQFDPSRRKAHEVILRFLGAAGLTLGISPGELMNPEPWNQLNRADGTLCLSSWDTLAKVDGLHPKMHVAESWRIEIINLQASSAAALGDLELSCTYVEAGAKAAMAQSYEIWRSEASDVFKQIQLRWPNEARVKTLADLFEQ